MFKSTGILKYSIEQYPKLIVKIDQNISDYYRKLIPLYKKPNPQKYPAHISVVRYETPDFEFWEKYQNQEVEFFYEPIVHFGKVYCWLNVFCIRLEEIRLELGLPISSPYTRPPENFTKCFHTTIGNYK